MERLFGATPTRRCVCACSVMSYWICGQSPRLLPVRPERPVAHLLWRLLFLVSSHFPSSPFCLPGFVSHVLSILPSPLFSSFVLSSPFSQMPVLYPVSLSKLLHFLLWQDNMSVPVLSGLRPLIVLLSPYTSVIECMDDSSVDLSWFH